MKIDKTFKIKEKYFNAILRFEKPFELRHEKVEPGSIIKLECENGRYLVFRSGHCGELIYEGDPFECPYISGYYAYESENRSKDMNWNYKYVLYKNVIFDHDGNERKEFSTWYDTFCWEYINKAPTYLIEIAEILEVK